MKVWYALSAMAVAALVSVPAAAGEFDAGLTKFLNQQIRPLLADPVLVAAIKAQNKNHASLDEAGIAELDKTWRAEAKAGGGALINGVLANPLSRLLKARQDASGGLIVEMFVMDAKGLNVGQSGITSDYMQGDEPKWQKSFGAGPNATFIDEVDFDESSDSFLSQVSTTIVDPADGKPIGAITVGVNVEKLP